MTKKKHGSGRGRKSTNDGAQDTTVVYCSYSRDALVDGKCPNSSCPLFDEPQDAIDGDDGPVSDGDRE